jgi:hypothetical protein
MIAHPVTVTCFNSEQFMKTLISRYATIFLLAAWLSSSVVTVTARPAPANLSAQSPRATYIVRLSEPALAGYTGGIDGLAPTAPQAEGQPIDAHSPQAVAYTAYLNARQQAFLNEAANQFGRSLDATYHYTNVLNALAVPATPAEAEKMARMPGVQAVYPDVFRHIATDASFNWLDADDVWVGNTLPGLATQGEGILIGILDTGIISKTHPSFADLAADGYDHINPWGSGIYGGVCNPGDAHYEPAFACNDKLIAAYNFSASATAADTNGHGSNVASIAAGNHVYTATQGSSTGGVHNLTIAGIAPHANLIAYKVCAADCATSDILAAINQAVSDSVDVLNLSLSGFDAPWDDPVSLAFLDASQVGIFVATAGDNTGPQRNTVHNTAPWYATVGNATHQRVFSKSLDIVLPYTSTLQGLAAMAASGAAAISADVTAEIAYDPTNLSGCTAFSAGYFTNKLALLELNAACPGVNLTQKVTNAKNAGASAVLLINDRTGPPPTYGVSNNTIRVATLGREDGLAVRGYIAAQSPLTVTARINYIVKNISSPQFGDVIYRNSGRGPSDYDILAPDFAAPGVNILGASIGASGYQGLVGTSQASPQVAGAAALLMALYPGWTPSQINSALSTTARPWWEIRVDNAITITAATPFDTGSGRINIGQASRAGLVMDETYAHYLAANPNAGGNPQVLNLPGLVNQHCLGICSWQRTFTSVLTETTSYAIGFYTTVPTLTLTTQPAAFNLAPGASQTVTFTAQINGPASEQTLFASALLTPSRANTATQHLTFALTPAQGYAPELVQINTFLKTGSQAIPGLISAYEVVTLTAQVAGLSAAQVISGSIGQDPTPDDPFDTGSNTYTHTFSVPANTLRLVVEATQSDAQRLVVNLGSGGTPSSATWMCQGVSYQPMSYCEIENPSAGNYWLMAQNTHSAAPGSSDAFSLALGIVISGTSSSLSVDALNDQAANMPINALLRWNEPGLQNGQHWYGWVSFGRQPATPGDIGRTKINLIYRDPVYSFTVQPQMANDAAAAGEAFTYTLAITNTGEVTDTFSVAVTSLWGVTAPVEIGPLPAGESAALTAAIHIPGGVQAGERDTAVVTVHSQGNWTVSSTVTLITTAWMRLYLPWVGK